METTEPAPSLVNVSQEELFAQIDQYPWPSDQEFQSGLQAILSSAPSPEDAEHLTLMARCFYYSRKFDVPVNTDAYISWHVQLHKQPVSRQQNAILTNGNNSHTPASSFPPQQTSQPANIGPSIASDQIMLGSNTSTDPSPPYPTTFTHIVDLITSGQPIPGIKEIPNTVLEGQGTLSMATKRKKPWEKDDDGGTEE